MHVLQKNISWDCRKLLQKKHFMGLQEALNRGEVSGDQEVSGQYAKTPVDQFVASTATQVPLKAAVPQKSIDG
jgi:hypothetical protein